MRTIDRTLRKSSPSPMTGIALLMACASGALFLLEWIPTVTLTPAHISKGSAYAAPRVVQKCADSTNSKAAVKHVDSHSQDANLAVLLEWHMSASSGLGVRVAGISCSAWASSHQLVARTGNAPAPGATMTTGWAGEKGEGKIVSR